MVYSYKLHASSKYRWLRVPVDSTLRDGDRNIEPLVVHVTSTPWDTGEYSLFDPLVWTVEFIYLFEQTKCQKDGESEPCFA